VLGLDNNQRAVLFGPEGDTSWSLQRLRQDIPGYEHSEIDIRGREGILRLVKSTRPSVVVHTAAQPSHDRAADPLRCFRYKCGRHAKPAGSRAALDAGVAIYSYVGE